MRDSNGTWSSLARTWLYCHPQRIHLGLLWLSGAKRPLPRKVINKMSFSRSIKSSRRFWRKTKTEGSAFVAQGAATHLSSPGSPTRSDLARVGAALRALGLFSVAVSLLVICSTALAADKGKTVTWKPITQALLRVDDQAVKNWNVYEENKKGDPLLLEMGNRYLLIQVHERKVFELAPAKIEHKGADLLWDAATLPSEPLASADWLIKDVGFAYRIGVRLVAENRVLDLQLPHPMDLRYL